MVRESKLPSSDPVLSKRRLGWAGLAALVACATCCAVPLLAAAGMGGAATATVSRILRPGSELVVGGLTFLLVLGLLATRARGKRSAGCGSSCSLDGSCCEQGAKARGV